MPTPMSDRTRTRRSVLKSESWWLVLGPGAAAELKANASVVMSPEFIFAGHRGQLIIQNGAGGGRKANVPARSCDLAGTKWGVGGRHALFPGLAIRRALAASFPTLFSTANGVSGLVAGPSGTLRPPDY